MEVQENVIFGDLVKGQTSVNIESGMYPAIVDSVDISREKKTDREKKEYEQVYASVFFRVKTPTSVERLRRKFPVNFGRGDDTTAWTDFLSAVSGIPSKDKAELRKLGTADVMAKRCRVVVKPGNPGYIDITDVMPPPQQVAQQRTPPQVRQPEPEPVKETWAADDIPDSEIPF